MLKPQPVPGSTTIAGIEGEFDEQFRNVVELVVQYDKASPALLQRRLSIGYARAARLMDQLQKAGVIGPQDGSKPREVLIHSAEEILGKEGDTNDSQVLVTNDPFYLPNSYKNPPDVKLTKVDNPLWQPQLLEALNSDAFKGSNHNFPIPLGVDEKENLLTADLPSLGNLIVVGNPVSQREISLTRFW